MPSNSDDEIKLEDIKLTVKKGASTYLEDDKFRVKVEGVEYYDPT